MGRHKKNESAVLVRLLNQFYETQARGDIRRLKYSNLARYAEEQGVHAAWYDFQRDKAVVQRMEELRTVQAGEPPIVTAAYKSLDIEALLKRCRTMEELKRMLCELDGYWKRAYDDSVELSHQNRDAAARTQELEKKLDALSETLEELEQQMRALRRENTWLRRMLRENLYPAIADQLLSESNSSSAVPETVRPEAFSRLIEGNVPLPLNGVQQPQPQKMSRQEQLLADMRRQVKEHGK